MRIDLNPSSMPELERSNGSANAGKTAEPLPGRTLRRVRWPGAQVPRRGPGLYSHDGQARIAFLPLRPTAQSLFLRGRIVL